jgi:two-component system LytT family response regulator
MKQIRTLVIEDQQLAREHLVTLLGEEPDIDVVAACSTGRQAVESIGMLRPDLVFLDLDLPELDGFEVIDAVGPEAMPPTIFVTAYDEFALRAFDVHAFDYLLKPFSRTRLQEALERARLHFGSEREGELARRLMSLAQDARPARAAASRFLVRAGGRVLFVPFAEIDWVESDGNYVRLHAGGRRHVMRETMASIEGRLAGQRFARVHRTRIVNLDRVRALEARGNGEYDIVMVNGARFRVGRVFRESVQRRLQAD